MTVIAITGANGFIGQALLRYLKICNLKTIVLNGDVRNKSTYNYKFDVLIHLAGAKHNLFIENPSKAWAVNVEGTKQALEACVRNYAHLVLASTSGVYEVDQKMPVAENGVLNPISKYGESKLACEKICFEQAETDITAMRIFNPYGVGQSEDMIIGYLVSKLLKKQIPEIKSPYSERDFIYINDLVKAIEKISGNPNKLQVVNIGSGFGTNVITVFEEIKEILNLDLETNITSSIASTSVIADISRMKSYGWKPDTLLKTGLSHLLNDVV
jgi:nucleoside-diphosphate-sugar epimerase